MAIAKLVLGLGMTVVLLGIAGGALITLVVELAKLRRIRPARPMHDG